MHAANDPVNFSQYHSTITETLFEVSSTAGKRQQCQIKWVCQRVDRLLKLRKYL